MEIERVQQNGAVIAVVVSEEPVITDANSAREIIAQVSNEFDTNRIVIGRDAIDAGFYELPTGLAGDILQQFMDYDTKLAIYGDFDIYGSNALAEFIREANEGDHLFFAESREAAIVRLARE